MTFFYICLFYNIAFHHSFFSKIRRHRIHSLIEKQIKFSQHALINIADRGTSKEEVEITIRTGECFPAKKGRIAFRKNFNYNSIWKGKIYQIKQVMPIVSEEPDRFVVVTVYVFFIGGMK